MKVVVIISGGMDSVTLAHEMRNDHPEGKLHLVSFDYGQRHVKELEYAAECARDVDASGFDIIDLTGLTPLLATSGSSLVDRDTPVPDGHYAEETMKITVVPNRNAIMLSIATGIAVAEGASYVATGVHSGDHAIYPDCRPKFIEAMDQAMWIGNEGFARQDFSIIAPFMAITKADIASIGSRLGVDYSKTWSCYKGQEVHCGTCGTCTERKEAFSLAGIVDPTEYLQAGNAYV
jgi:7-cyano-7-deazaguanine synthase